MMASIRSEWRKLWTVRTTYIFIALIILVILFYAGFITGFRAQTSDLQNPGYLTSQITGAIGAVIIFVGIVGLLQFGNEYRWSTITYTLTASNSRTKTLFSKLIVVTIFALIASAFICALSPLATIVGIHLHHHTLVKQIIPYGTLWWQCLLFGWGYAILGFILVGIIRNQIGAIIAFLLIPTTVESLLSLLLKNNSRYLPFTSLRVLIDPGYVKGATNTHTAALTAALYIVGSWLVMWYLFVKRDAN